MTCFVLSSNQLPPEFLYKTFVTDLRRFKQFWVIRTGNKFTLTGFLPGCFLKISPGKPGDQSHELLSSAA